jgi:hypothetical protein
MKGPPSSPNQPRVTVNMTDLDVIRRVRELTGGVYIQSRAYMKNPKWKRSFIVHVKGRRAVDLMTLLRPLMGARRQIQIDTALASYIPRQSGDNTRKLTQDKVRRIRYVLLRKKPPDTVARVARRYGVSRTAIRRIRDNELWKPRMCGGFESAQIHFFEAQTRHTPIPLQVAGASPASTRKVL